jgi:hypothetical protein
MVLMGHLGIAGILALVDGAGQEFQDFQGYLDIRELVAQPAGADLADGVE